MVLVEVMSDDPYLLVLLLDWAHCPCFYVLLVKVLLFWDVDDAAQAAFKNLRTED